MLPRLESKLLCAVKAAELRPLLALSLCRAAGERGTVTKRLLSMPIALLAAGCTSLPGGAFGSGMRAGGAGMANRRSLTEGCRSTEPCLVEAECGTDG